MRENVKLLFVKEMAIFSSCFLAEHSGRPTSRLPTAFCLAPHGPVIITRPTRLATFPFMPCVAHFRPPLLCPRGFLWRQSCDWSSIWSTFGKLRSKEAGKQLLDGIWAIQNQLDNKWGNPTNPVAVKPSLTSCRMPGVGGPSKTVSPSHYLYSYISFD